MSVEQVTDLTYDGTQERYHAIRRRQAEEVAKIVPTAKPFPQRKTGLYGWRLRPCPGELDLTDADA